MGTRHIVGVVRGGEYVLAQYGQWDGYPSHTGTLVIQFLSEPGNVQRLTKGLQNVRQVTDEDMSAVMESLGIEPGAQGLTMEQSEALELHWPSLHRNTGSDILELVASSTSTVLVDIQTAFLEDDLMCEWAYIIDLDQETLTVYANGLTEVRGVFLLESLPTPDESLTELLVRVDA